MDVDHFKKINDTYGHNTGDMVLESIGEILRNDTRRTDEAGRWGGEEFIIISPEINIVEAGKLAEKLRISIQTNEKLKKYSCTSSFGIAEFSEGDTLDSLVNRADKALYRAKNEGRNRVVPRFSTL